MADRRGVRGHAQAWIELNAEDPEARSALEVARAHLAAGKPLQGLRRLRVFELSGRLPAAEPLAELLHRSTQFYNPHKERCTVRTASEDPPPLANDEHVVLVWERGGERRPAAERWWQHETKRKIEVREGTAWVLRFERGERPAERAVELAELKDRRHGLLCNPHSQEYRLGHGGAPLPWWPATPARKEPT